MLGLVCLKGLVCRNKNIQDFIHLTWFTDAKFVDMFFEMDVKYQHVNGSLFWLSEASW